MCVMLIQIGKLYDEWLKGEDKIWGLYTILIAEGEGEKDR